MKKLARAFLVFLITVGSFLVFWLVGLKLLKRLLSSRMTIALPCPAALSFLLDNPVRRRTVSLVLDRLELRTGQRVLELGPGPGAFTVDAALRVGVEGRVIAVDIQPAMIAKVERRVKAAGLTNVETHVAGAYELPLEDAGVDCAFAVTVLPEIPDPVRALREVYRVLKPGGRLSVTEEFPDPDYPRIETTIRWAEAAGFELEAHHGNWWLYTLNFRKPLSEQAQRAHSYYVLRRPALLREFDSVAAKSRLVVAGRYGEAAADAMIAEARQEYAALIPHLPYIGGNRKQTLTGLVVATAWYLAIYRVIRRRGGTVEDAGQLCYELAEEFIRQTPAFVRRMAGNVAFSDSYRQRVRQAALESQQRRYPHDYVYEYVEGDGTTFDFGVNYTQCTAYEFLKAQGAPELAPYICPIDMLYSEIFGWGLKRTTTLAEGGACCDFRFRRGAPTQVASHALGGRSEPALPATEAMPAVRPRLSAEELSAISETMLFTLYMRARENEEPLPILKDPRAMELVRQLDYDFSYMDRERLDQVGVAVRLRRFDGYVRQFLADHPDGAVVSLGCGLDTRFDRVDNGQVTWYDLDLPPVIALRRRLMDEAPRYHMVGCSALDPAWVEMLALPPGKPVLLLAEGVLFFFSEAEVRQLVRMLQARFPGAELIFDAKSPYAVRHTNAHLRWRGVAARVQWGVKDGRVLEGWAPGIRLLETWYFADETEPRMGAFRLLRWLPLFRKSTVLYRYRLGDKQAADQQ